MLGLLLFFVELLNICKFLSHYLGIFSRQYGFFERLLLAFQLSPEKFLYECLVYVKPTLALILQFRFYQWVDCTLCISEVKNEQWKDYQLLFFIKHLNQFRTILKSCLHRFRKNIYILLLENQPILNRNFRLLSPQQHWTFFNRLNWVLSGDYSVEDSFFKVSLRKSLPLGKCLIMEGLVKRKAEVNIVLRFPLMTHVVNPFFEHFNSVLKNFPFSLQGSTFLTHLMHDNALLQLSIVFDFVLLT